jgi:endonuclease/exonuclease/phosphatase (EEP) superfamily protein YafD
MTIIRFILISLAGSVCVLTLLPVFRTDEWWVRIWDFPRVQLFIIGLVTLSLHLVFFRKGPAQEKVLFFLLIAALIVQAVRIFPYTFLARPEVVAAKQHGSSAAVSILIANVLKTNRQHRPLIEMVSRYRPDLILLTETDTWWAEQMRPLEKEYPFTCIYPLDNTYGMSLYSRFELVAPRVKFLTAPAVPSIHADIHLPDGALIRFYGVHPRPPGLQRAEAQERQDTEQRDAELVMIGRRAAALSRPVIVAGDFNDVAWSRTTRLFQRVSRLLDPRIGRGFYNTYNAKLRFLRFPVDHLFHSEEFTLQRMERLGYIGSDHFPIFAALVLRPAAEALQDAPERKPTDPSRINEILRELKEEQEEGR